jgi:hypothetical protein
MFAAYNLPILSTIPRSGTWFLRYAISFLCHLERGGRIDDRLTGRIVGNPFGPRFDFQRFRGGPLFRVAGTLPIDHLFIGHTVCPGFDAGRASLDWWSRTPFHVRGFDYLHEGFNYRYTPVELAPYDYAPVRVKALEAAAYRGRGKRVVLVYRNPLDQAASYLRYSCNHTDPAYSVFRGRPLSRISLRDYMFGGALASYAKQFISFQEQARRYPGLVQLIPYERLIAQPVETLAAILDHLAGAPQEREMLADAVQLARREHMKTIEKEIGHSLDGTRVGRGSHIQRVDTGRPVDAATRDAAMAFLQLLGVDTDLFEWPASSDERVSA